MIKIILIFIICIFLCYIFMHIFLYCGSDITQASSAQELGGLNAGGSAGGSGGSNTKVYMDTVKTKDSTVLADYFQNHHGNYVRDTVVKFSGKTLSARDEYLSRIARYVRTVDPGIFYRVGPDSTPIHGNTVARIRALNLDVPTNFK